MATGLPKVVYNSTTTVQFTNGPQSFSCDYLARVHDNDATSGLRERVVEPLLMVITFKMGYLDVISELAAWMALETFLLNGGQIDFYPNVLINEAYHCISLDTKTGIGRTGWRKYGLTFNWRIVPDSSAPADPSVVMRLFYGQSSP